MVFFGCLCGKAWNNLPDSLCTEHLLTTIRHFHHEWISASSPKLPCAKQLQDPVKTVKTPRCPATKKKGKSGIPAERIANLVIYRFMQNSQCGIFLAGIWLCIYIAGINRRQIFFKNGNLYSIVSVWAWVQMSSKKGADTALLQATKCRKLISLQNCNSYIEPSKFAYYPPFEVL